MALNSAQILPLIESYQPSENKVPLFLEILNTYLTTYMLSALWMVNALKSSEKSGISIPDSLRKNELSACILGVAAISTTIIVIGDKVYDKPGKHNPALADRFRSALSGVTLFIAHDTFSTGTNVQPLWAFILLTLASAVSSFYIGMYALPFSNKIIVPKNKIDYSKCVVKKPLAGENFYNAIMGTLQLGPVLNVLFWAYNRERNLRTVDMDTVQMACTLVFMSIIFISSYFLTSRPKIFQYIVTAATAVMFGSYSYAASSSIADIIVRALPEEEQDLDETVDLLISIFSAIPALFCAYYAFISTNFRFIEKHERYAQLKSNIDEISGNLVNATVYTGSQIARLPKKCCHCLFNAPKPAEEYSINNTEYSPLLP